MATVAGIAGQTIDRARLSDAEHHLVTDMQAALLTPLPKAAGLEVAERYRPAVADLGMGGDWYEGIVLGDGRYLVVVGDVAGHGIAAVAKMAQLRSTIGTIAALGTPLAEVLPRATTRPPGTDLVVASAALVEIDLPAGLLRYACAGHPPPLVRLPDGSVAQLRGGRQPLLGVEMSPRPAAEHPFPPGSALVCFTDGLVERRDEGIDESVGRLAEVLAASAATGAGELADDLLARCLVDEHDDDVAIAVVVHRGGVAGS
jgi:serine phosphatase RsbU (regulator of sigma subunit)